MLDAFLGCIFWMHFLDALNAFLDISKKSIFAQSTACPYLNNYWADLHDLGANRLVDSDLVGVAEVLRYTILFGQANPTTPTPRRRGFNARRGPVGPQSPRRGSGSLFGSGGPPTHGPPGDQGLVFRLGESEDSQEVDGESFHSFRIDGGNAPARFTTPNPNGATPLFYVIEDPRGDRQTSGNSGVPRQRSRDRFSGNRVNQRNGGSGFAPTEAPRRFARPQGTTPRMPPARDGEAFALAESNGESVLVRLRPEYTLRDFKWFGVYDHCENLRTAYVPLDGVEAPQETAIPGIRGWKHNVGSQSIIIMNCNTILLKNFSFDGSQAEGHIYVGIGDFPKNIVQQVRAYVVGTVPDRRLNDYNQEDIMVRLPPGWKTFDVNFISIYDPTHRISYGHAPIPPVIVPPCEDLFQ